MGGGDVSTGDVALRRELPLEASEWGPVPVSGLLTGDRRLEAGNYLSAGAVVRRRIAAARMRVWVVGELGEVWQPSRLRGVQVDADFGVPFLAATQVFDIWPEPRKWLAPSKTPDLVHRYVEPGWILVTCSGTVGNAILSYAAHDGRLVSHDLLRLEVEKTSMRCYLLAFLRTWFGKTIMRSSHYGSAVKHLEAEHLRDVPVPVVEAMLPKVQEGISEALSARDEAYRLDLLARGLFAEAMADQPEQVQEEGYSISSADLVRGRRRLEAAAHSPGARFVSQVYERNAKSVVCLGSVATASVPGRFKRIFATEGVGYLDSEPIFKVNPELSKHLANATAIDFEDYAVQSGWLLMACSGQTYGINGRAILANAGHEGKVVTQHIMRITPRSKSIRAGYLQTVLSHPTLGQPLVVSRAYGTSVPELAPEDIEALPVPRLSEAVEDRIADVAERASALRFKADARENVTVGTLERELESRLGIGPASQKNAPAGSADVNLSS